MGFGLDVAGADPFDHMLMEAVVGKSCRCPEDEAFLAPGVEVVFDGTAPVTALDGWIACYGFAAQIFCDFSGYSLCAIGVAK
ncbi:MAG: hypothetical protein AAFX00_00410, partial [Pseudomonadota bacterium]